jgi:hypothetical protein
MGIDDELFRMWGGGIDYALSPDFKGLSDDERDALYERYKTNLAKTAKQTIYKDLEIIIGTSANLDGSTDTGLLYKKVKKYCE